MRTNTIYVHLRDPDRLRTAIGKSGVSQAHIARRCNLNPERISQLVLGKTRSLPIPDAAALENALGVMRGTLFRIPDAELAAEYIRAA
jgi:transcriptional regulator with XRE-family HTH domain